MAQYDRSHDNFLEVRADGSRVPHPVLAPADPDWFQIRECKLPLDNGGSAAKDHGGDANKCKQVKLNILDLLKQQCPDIASFDKDQLFENFKHSAPLQLLEIDNSYGSMFLAVDNYLFVFNKQQAYEFLIGHKLNSNNIVSFSKKFDGMIKFIKCTPENLIINIKDKIKVFHKERFIAADGQELPMVEFSLDFGEGTHVRQIATSGKNILITDSNQKLYEYANDRISTYEGPIKLRSAIYNQSGAFIIGLPNEDSEDQDHIHVFKAGELQNLAVLKSIKLDFPQEIRRNHCRTYFITEYEHGVAFIYAAFYASDGDQDDNVGTPLIFTVSEDITNATSFESLKPSIQYFYDTDAAHNNDEDEDCKIPIAKACWLETDVPVGEAAQRAGNLQNATLGQVCMLQVNHCIKPHMFFRHQDGRFEVANVETNADYNTPSIARPDGPDELDCLGSTLGITWASCVLSEEQKRDQNITLFSDEEPSLHKSAPILAIYGLDGHLKTWYCYHKAFKTVKILKDTVQVRAINSIPAPRVNQISSNSGGGASGAAAANLRANSGQVNQNLEEQKQPQPAAGGFGFGSKPLGSLAGFGAPPIQQPSSMPFGGASGQSPLVSKLNAFQSFQPISANQIAQIHPQAPPNQNSNVHGFDSPPNSCNREPQDHIPVNPLDAARKEQQKDQKRFEKFLSQRFDVETIEEYKGLEQPLKEQIVAAYEQSKAESRQQNQDAQNIIQSQFDQLRRVNNFSDSGSLPSDSAPEEEDDKHDSQAYQIVILQLEEKLCKFYNRKVISKINKFKKRVETDLKSFPDLNELQVQNCFDDKFAAEIDKRISMVNRAVISSKVLTQQKEQIKRELMLGRLFEQDIVNQRETFDPAHSDLATVEALLARLGEKKVNVVNSKEQVPFLSQEDRVELLEVYRKTLAYFSEFDKTKNKVKYKEMIHQMVIRNMEEQGVYDASGMAYLMSRIQEDSQGLQNKHAQGLDPTTVIRMRRQRELLNSHATQNIDQTATTFLDHHFYVQTAFIDEIQRDIQSRLNIIANQFVVPQKQPSTKAKSYYGDSDNESQLQSSMSQTNLNQTGITESESNSTAVPQKKKRINRKRVMQALKEGRMRCHQDTHVFEPQEAAARVDKTHSDIDDFQKEIAQMTIANHKQQAQRSNMVTVTSVYSQKIEHQGREELVLDGGRGNPVKQEAMGTEFNKQQQEQLQKLKEMNQLYQSKVNIESKRFEEQERELIKQQEQQKKEAANRRKKILEEEKEEESKASVMSMQKKVSTFSSVQPQAKPGSGAGKQEGAPPGGLPALAKKTSSIAGLNTIVNTAEIKAPSGLAGNDAGPALGFGSLALNKAKSIIPGKDKQPPPAALNASQPSQDQQKQPEAKAFALQGGGSAPTASFGGGQPRPQGAFGTVKLGSLQNTTKTDNKPTAAFGANMGGAGTFGSFAAAGNGQSSSSLGFGAKPASAGFGAANSSAGFLGGAKPASSGGFLSGAGAGSAGFAQANAFGQKPGGGQNPSGFGGGQAGAALGGQAPSGFGGQTSAFGGQQQQQQSAPFGQQAAFGAQAPSAFGGQPSAFGGQQLGQAPGLGLSSLAQQIDKDPFASSGQTVPSGFGRPMNSGTTQSFTGGAFLKPRK